MTELPSEPHPAPAPPPAAPPPEAQSPEAQPSGAQPAEAQPSGAQPVEAQSPEAQPTERQPGEGQPQAAAPSARTALSSMDASALLVRALGQLPPADRDRVYTWLLGTGFQTQPGAGVLAPLVRAVQTELPAARQQDFAEQGADLVRTLFRGSPSAGQQMVPVRFSTEQHARLRAWCTEHGFSMATVIRGLVDRFLDGQQPPGH